jgi:lipoyl(octanoyl) transferase
MSDSREDSSPASPRGTPIDTDIPDHGLRTTHRAPRTPPARVVDLGRLSWDEALARQEEAAAGVLAGGPEVVLLVEHPPVVTLGSSADAAHLLAPLAEFERRGIALRETNRGGDVTMHLPGQIVAYPIVDLRRRGRDVHRHVRALEQAVIDTLDTFGPAGERHQGRTGVWIGERKIAAIGVAVRRWITLHGLALNVACDLSIFDLIVPCGLHGYGVTSMEAELGKAPSLAEVRDRLAAALARVLTPREPDHATHPTAQATTPDF